MAAALPHPIIDDPYLYDIPIKERHNLCQMILHQNVWHTLAEHMGYDRKEIDEMKSYTYETKDKEAEELLIRWGEQNHTITELFVLLSRIQQYAVMDTIRNLVDSRYHILIKEFQVTHPSKKRSILNGTLQSNECNESDRLRKDDKKSRTFGVNDCAITKIDYEVLRDATNNWSDKNMLGKGGFGTVFKGMWLSTTVAIKRIENRGRATAEMSKNPIQQSLNELKHLNSCRHDNILPLYGVSMDGAEPCLVYQLMYGGSLEDRLFSRASDVSPLTWQQRINIAGGTARGLRFLHTFGDLPLIHGDIKPGNILLDPMNIPKIGDFGLVREGNEDEMIVSCAYGTRPYLPDEFISEKKLTTKVDSFSFGIVLFEISTGLRAYNNRTKSFLIKNIQYRCIQGTLLDLIDKTADNVRNKEEIFRAIIELGLNCTKDKHEDRPDMVKVLEFFEEKFGGNWDVNECAGAIPKIDYELLRDATNNWSNENVLGKGGFGTVFKGMWNSTAVAIKRIENRGLATAEISKIQIQQNLNELRHFNSCRHENILPLYGVSMNGAEPCLVYQLMQGGSLEQRLFNRSSDVSPLTWQQRINIAGGTARGVQFLHTFQKRPLIHRNIRPANIFLDSMGETKIGKPEIFGEVNKDRMFPYLPIEYLVSKNSKNLSTKVDSFSFGIVLFELSTGLRAYDTETKTYLNKTIESHDCQGNLLDLIDNTAGDVEDREIIFKRIMDLGKKCTNYDCENRLGMAEAVRFLEEWK